MDREKADDSATLQVKLLMWSELVYKRTSLGKEPLGKSSTEMTDDDSSGKEPEVTIPVEAGRDDAAAGKLQAAVAGGNGAKAMDADGSNGDAEADEVGSIPPRLMHHPYRLLHSQC